MEEAARKGTLTQVEGMTERRVKALKDILDSMLFRSAGRRARRINTQLDLVWEPDVSALLDVDQEYRSTAEHCW